MRFQSSVSTHSAPLRAVFTTPGSRVFVVLALFAALNACSKSEAPKADAPKGDAPRAAAPGAAKSVARAPTATSKTAVAPVPVDRVCGGLKKTLEQVTDSTDPAQLAATFTMEVAKSFENAAALHDKIGQLDAAATANCPAERVKVLAMLKKSSLADAFLNPGDPPAGAGPPQKK